MLARRNVLTFSGNMNPLIVPLSIKVAGGISMSATYYLILTAYGAQRIAQLRLTSPAHRCWSALSRVMPM
jgi:hypothetical protein